MRVGPSIKKLRESHGMTQEQLGKVAGVSSMAVSQWENGRAVPRMGSIQRMADYFKVPKSTIMGDVVTKPDPHASFTDVPLYGAIAAGTPIEMVEVDDYHPVPTEVHSRYPDAFLLKVEGDSMDRVLPNGCYALVDPCDDIDKDGEPYAVCVNGYDATIKRVRKLNNGFELVPDSTDPTYATQTYNYNEPDTKTITVIGRVVYYVLPYDWTF